MGRCAEARTSVWWDIDGCGVPACCCDPHRVAHRRRHPRRPSRPGGALLHRRLPQPRTKDGTDKRMLVDMLFWAIDNPPPGNYLLISGDQDFSDLLHRLGMKRYGILLAQPSNASSQVLAAAAKVVWSWERLVAGELLANTHSVLDCNPKLNGLDVSKCSQSKASAVCHNGASNVKACNQYKVKPVQKYVKKNNAISNSANNQDQVISVDGFSDDFAGSTGSDQDKSSVSSSTSSSESLEVDLPSLLETPLAESSAQEPGVSTSSQQVGPLSKSIIAEKPRTSAEFVPRKGTLDFGLSNEHNHQMFMQSQPSEAKNKLHSEYDMAEKNAKKTDIKFSPARNQFQSKPIQRYVKKTSITSSPASNQLDSDGMPDCSMGNTPTKLNQLPVLSPPNCELLEGIKVDHSSLLGTFNLSQPSSQAPVVSTHFQVKAPHELIFGKKTLCTSTEHASRDETSNMGDNVGKAKTRNQHKVTQRQHYVKKTNTVSSSAQNKIDLVKGLPVNSKGNTLSDPNKSMLSASNSESLLGAKVNCSTPLKNSAPSLSAVHKPFTHDLQPVGSEFSFGKNPSLSIDCMPKDGTFHFGATNGHNSPACQQAQSLPEQHESVPPSSVGHSNSANPDVGSSEAASTGFNGVPSAQRQISPSSSTFQNLLDICSDFSRLTISQCPPGRCENGPTFQSMHANPAFSMQNISGHPRGPHEIGSIFHPGSGVSSALQTVQSPSNNCTLKPHSPNLSCNIKNPCSHGETQGYPPSSSEPEVTIRNILHALHILKAEKVFPTESNIADCIRYSEMNMSGFDVKKALELSIRHQAVVMKKLVNDMPLFVAKDESIWKCVNVTNRKAKHPKETLDTVHKYISSTDGWSEIKNSQSRYQAATILKKTCLQQHALGDVLQILHIIIVRKKWILPHSSGWQPLSINTTVVDATAVAVGESRS
uniref:Uncharacterized protein n=1 Tax=Oryza brachyantha TaxID=4533 RepID=J3LP41_ORYBR